MNAADRSNLLKVLHSRRDAIADSWYQALARTSFVSLSATEVRQRLVELTEQAVTLLLTEPLERRRAEAIGASLARLRYVQPEALGRTQEVLACQLVEGLPDEQIVALQPRLAALLGGLATGFFRQTRETILAEQERIHNALITKHKRVEQALRESEQTARALLNAPTDPALLVKPDGTIVALNKAAAKRLGKGSDELVGMCVMDLLPPDVAERRKAEADKAVRSGKRVRFEDERGGRWFDQIVYPVFDAQGQVVQLAISALDITEFKQAEQALRESEGTARALLNTPTDVAALIDTRGIILDANETMARRFRRRVDELIGSCVWDLFPSDVSERRKAYVSKVIQSGKPVRFEDEREGMWNDNVIYPVLDAQGKVTRVAVLARDITERRRAEEGLRRYTERLKILREIDQAILAEQSLEAIAQAALRRIRQLVACQWASVILFDLEASEGVVIAACGRDQTRLGEGERFSLDARWIDVLRQGEVYVVESLPHSHPLSPVIQALRAEGVRSCTCVPLISQDELIGSLDLGWQDPHAPALEHLEVAREVADSLAVGIQQARLFQSVKQRGRQLRALTARLAEAEEAERRRLACELHDMVGQKLTALGINLNLVRTHLPEEVPELVCSRLADSVALVEETTESIRRVMEDLRPPMLDAYGLVATLHWYGARFASWTGIAVTVQGEEPVPRLAAPAENALFRIAQEVLTNVAKHAQATQVMVTVTADDKAMRLVIADDGVGFDPAQLNRPDGRRGWGLITMAERAQAVGGCLQIESRPQQGTQVIVELPR